jgi:hypothetical protein
VLVFNLRTAKASEATATGMQKRVRQNRNQSER